MLTTLTVSYIKTQAGNVGEIYMNQSRLSKKITYGTRGPVGYAITLALADIGSTSY